MCDPFLCALGLANIEIVEREGLKETARQGRYVKEALEAMKARFEIVGDVRGLGHEADEALAILDAAIAQAQQDIEAPFASITAWM